jgi:hypothetical protein
MSENNMKLLFTTHGFKLLGIVTYDKKEPDESLGIRRRWVKGLVMENGHPLPPEDRVFETTLDRKNPKSGKLEDIVAHEDDLVIVMERKTFELDEDEKNFQFMPNMHLMNRIQQITDEIEEGRRRISRLQEEKEETILNSEHFEREAKAAKEREKTQKEIVNRLTRENNMLAEQIGNLESVSSKLRSKNLELEAFVDETTANAQEKGTMRGMTTSDLVLSAVETTKDIHQAMMDIAPGEPMDDSGSEEDIDLKEQVKKLTEMVNKLTEAKQAQKV